MSLLDWKSEAAPTCRTETEPRAENCPAAPFPYSCSMEANALGIYCDGYGGSARNKRAPWERDLGVEWESVLPGSASGL